MWSSTQASRDRLVRSAVALMDLDYIPRQSVSAQALGVLGKAEKGRFVNVICIVRQRGAIRAWPVSDQPALSKLALFPRRT